jgi:hypothetical protein
MKVLAPLLSLVCCCAVHAFDIDGFRTGADRETVMAQLRDRGMRSIQSAASGPGEVEVIFERSDGELWEFLTFCRDRLVSYQYNLAGGVAAFLRAVAREHERRGPASYRPSAEETKVGEHLALDLSFPDGVDRYVVGLSSIAGQEPQVYVVHKSPNACDDR